MPLNRRVLPLGQYRDVRREWHDGKHKRVEDCLNDFILHLCKMAEALKEHRAAAIRAQLTAQRCPCELY